MLNSSYLGLFNPKANVLWVPKISGKWHNEYNVHRVFPRELTKSVFAVVSLIKWDSEAFSVSWPQTELFFQPLFLQIDTASYKVDFRGQQPK